MIIELVGLPGSGKSTLIKTLKEYKLGFFSYEEIHNRYFKSLPLPAFLASTLKIPFEKAKYLSFVFLKDLLVANMKSRRNWAFLRALIRRGIPEKDKRRFFIRQYKRRTLLQYVFSRKYKSEILIFDEGELQILMTFLKNGDIDSIRKYNANKVVILSVNPDIASERIFQRTRETPNNNSYSETTLKFPEIKINNLSLIIRNLENHNIPVFITDNGLTVSHCLADFIRKNNLPQ